MAKTKEEIISDIEEYFRGTNYSSCYVGISSDARKRLFEEHNVSEKDDAWIIRTASSHTEAREIEKHFLDAGMDGGGGGGDETSNKVYAYKKAYYTHP